MRLPLSMTASLAAYILWNRLHPPRQWQLDLVPECDTSGGKPLRTSAQGCFQTTAANGQPHPLLHKRFPIVLMLEPLHACNLSCTGCGRIREYESTVPQKLTLEQCLGAVDECGAPVVSICGGEPLLYPEIGELVRQLIARRKHIYLCTNGLLVRKRLKEFRPHPSFFFNIHLDGLEQTHDRIVEREGVFREAIQAIRAAKQAGFKVSTNTTVYKDTDMGEVEALLEYLEPFRLDGHMLSPAYGYTAADEKGIFLTREEIHAKFRHAHRLARRFKLVTTPLYLDFLQGKRELPCTAWGNPTYNVLGWRSPCYLISDAHFRTFEEFITRTPWASYGPGRDPRCQDCMVHCGYEPSAAMGIGARLTDGLRLLRWVLR